MKVLGLTGGTGAGKTTVLEILQKQGAAILDCDRIYYELLNSDKAFRSAITDTFGGVFLSTGELDRKKLGNLVFNDAAMLEKLNALVYQHLGLEIRNRLQTAKAQGSTLCVIDAVNLVESGLGELCHATVAVIAPEADRIRRIMQRDGIDEAYARARVGAQKNDDYYRSHCDAVLENCGDVQELAEKAQRLLTEILK